MVSLSLSPAAELEPAPPAWHPVPPSVLPLQVNKGGAVVELNVVQDGAAVTGLEEGGEYFQIVLNSFI